MSRSRVLVREEKLSESLRLLALQEFTGQGDETDSKSHS